MLKQIKTRLERIEQKFFSKIPFWPGDDDSFLESLGVDSEKYIVKNPDGSNGFDVVRALSATAAEDWRPEE